MRRSRFLAVILALVIMVGFLNCPAVADEAPYIVSDLKNYEAVVKGAVLVLSIEAENADQYQWYDGDTDEEIENATSASFSPDTSEEGWYWYYVVASNSTSDETAVSNCVCVIVMPESLSGVSLEVDTSSVGNDVAYGSNPLISATMTGVSGYECYFTWFFDDDYQGMEPSETTDSDDGSQKASSIPAKTIGDSSHTVYCQVYMCDEETGGAEEEYMFESEHVSYSVSEKPQFSPDQEIITTESCYVAVTSPSVLHYEQDPNATIPTYTVVVDSDEVESDRVEVYFSGKEGYESVGTVKNVNLPIISNTIDLSNDMAFATTDPSSLGRSFSVLLNEGTATETFYIKYITIELINGRIPMPVGHNEAIVIRFVTDEGAQSTHPISNAEISEGHVGQWENKNDLTTSNNAFIVVPYGKTNVDVTLTLEEEFDGVCVNGEAKQAATDGVVTVTLNASPDGAENIIAPTRPYGNYDITCSIICIAQKYTALPNRVVEYLCIGSQYTNRYSNGDDYGLRGVRSLVGSNYDAGGGLSGPVSLGNFGGYIVYYYEDAITDDPHNPYGIDFITFGNSVEGSNEFGEPGQVWVSEDGETWYALAGGMHYEDYADWNYQITYTKQSNGTSAWSDSHGREAEQPQYEYPLPEKYPWYEFKDGEDASITLRGIYFEPEGGENEFGNQRPPFAGFGYTDMGSRYTSTSGDGDDGDLEAMRARNIAGNPYLPLTEWNGRKFSKVTDGMDLAWAVDTEGQPIDVSGMEFHYVKIVTASNIDNGAIGEKSTEVNMVRVAQPNDEPVGKTAAPASIKIDGVALELEADKFVYDDVVVDGPFKVEVEAPEDAHIYINNNCASYADFDGMPLHKIVRVIVQEGEKEPVIYVINLTETTEDPAPAATLTLDCNGGNIDGNATYSIKFDANMAGDPLPEPKAPNAGVEFAGWYAGLQPVEAVIPAEVADVTYVAHWAQKATEPGEESVSVSFRLIGATKATADIELDKAEGEDPYNGAEYVTWIKTTNYTLTAGSTVADLIVKACGEAGLAQSNAQGGYVATVTAPAAYGGYELSEFTNGKRSGWMYTIGGAHPGRGVAEQVLKDGDDVILHYVNDYAMEVEDWAALGGEGWPSLYGDNTDYLNAWLAAEDVAPPEAETPSEPTKPSEPAEPFKMPFVDVPEDAFYYDAVAWAVQNGITNGTTETTFSPDDDCYREQIVTFLWRAAGEPEPTIESVPFVDLDESAYYYKAVFWAYEQGVTLGVDETHFGVGQVCTREQVVTFMYRAANKPAVSGDAPFTDVEAGAWYADAVKWAADAEITLGVGGGLFGTGLTCTRGQIVTFLYRASE